MTKNLQKEISALVRAGRLETVLFDSNFFNYQINACSRSRFDVLALAKSGSLEGAFALGYAFMRKSATLVLYCRGVRPTARGGHRVVVEALSLDQQISEKMLAVFEQLRVVRNSFEYPETEFTQIHHSLVGNALEIGEYFFALAARLGEKAGGE